MSGAVWQLGEDSTSYEDGVEVESESWQAGMDGASASMVMPSAPKVNDTFVSDASDDDEEETSRVTSLTESVSTPFGDFENVLAISEEDDEGTETLHYAADLGLIQFSDDDGAMYMLEEVEFSLASNLDTEPESDGDEEEEELSEAFLFFELNDTDGDLGIHGKADGEAWQTLTIEAPDGEEILTISLSGELAEQGLTELFFESAEPLFDELTPADFFNRFPEGTYEIDAESEDGEQEAEVMLSHVIPAAPDGVMLTYPVECEEGMTPDEDGDCFNSMMMPAAEFELDDEGERELVCVEIEDISEQEVSISWIAVTMSHNEKGTTAPHGQFLGKAGEVNVLHYEVVFETEDENELEIVSSNLVPSDVTEFELPEELLEISNEFKFEILVRDENGNQSAVEACFELPDDEEEGEEEDEGEEEGG